MVMRDKEMRNDVRNEVVQMVTISDRNITPLLDQSSQIWRPLETLNLDMSPMFAFPAAGSALEALGAWARWHPIHQQHDQSAARHGQSS